MRLYRALTYEESSRVKKKLLVIEEKYGFNFPSIYIQFITSFKTGQFCENREMILDENLNCRPLTSIRYISESERNVDYGWLYSINELAHDLRFFSEANTNLKEFQVIRIGNIIAGGGLFLGVGKNNQDNIYRFIWDIDKEPLQVEPNIFSFIQNLEKSPIEDFEQYQKSVFEKYYTSPKIGISLNKSFDLYEANNDNSLSTSDFINNLNHTIFEIRSKNT